MEKPEYNRVVLAEAKAFEKGHIYYEPCYFDGRWHICDRDSILAQVSNSLNSSLIVTSWVYLSDFEQLSFVFKQIKKIFVKKVVSLFTPIARFFIQLLTKFLLVIHRALLR